MRVKWLLFVVLLATAVFVTDPIFLMLESLILLALALRSGIPLGKLWLILKALIVLVALMFVLNMVVWHPAPTETFVFYLIPPLHMFPQTIEGLAYSLAMIWKSVVLILALRIITLVTPINELIEGLIAYKVPYKLAMPVGTGIQLAPMMLNMTTTLMEAQKSRGWEYEYKNPFKKLLAFSALLLPFIIVGRKIGEEVAISLEVRGFGIDPRRRTKWKKTEMTSFDYAIAFGLVLLLVCILVFGIYGTRTLSYLSTAHLVKHLASVKWVLNSATV